MKEPTQENFEIIEDILNAISPAQMKKIEQPMLHAEKIRKAMESKGWSKSMLLKALKKKNPSILTKWLSGTHNFTKHSLIEIGNLLDIDFFEK